MFSLFGRVFKLVFINIIILAVILYVSLSALTGKFPPDFKTIHNYSTNMLNFDKNFSATMNRSEDYIKAMHIDDDPQFAAKVLSGDPTAVAKLNSGLSKKDFSPLEAQVVLLSMQVKELRRELNTLKQQINTAH